MSITLGPSLQGSLSTRAAGRVLVIDAYRTRSCCAWIGDLTTRWEPAPPAAGFAAPVLLDGVPIVVRSSLVGPLEVAGATLHGSGLIRRDGVRIELDRPELWIAWLERPAAWRAAPVDVGPGTPDSRGGAPRP